MESSIRPGLYRDLDDWGYSLLTPDEKSDPSQLLMELTRSDEVRLLEGFPVVLSAWLSSEEGSALSTKLVEMENGLASAGEKKRFRLLVAATWQLLLSQPELEEKRSLLRDYLKLQDPNLMAEVRAAFAEGRPLNVGRVKLSPERLQTTFGNYVVANRMGKQERLDQQIGRAREIAFNESLSELFSQRQTEIVRKILARQPLTKTEREYFSRVIKKRLAAIANVDLQTLAASMLGRPDAFIRSELRIDEEK